VQEACARIGAVTEKGLAAVVAEHYNRAVLPLVVAFVIANTISIGADIGALAASRHLILPVPGVGATTARGTIYTQK
jgi:Mn2+/Fe2+ NRAMP family transporter